MARRSVRVCPVGGVTKLQSGRTELINTNSPHTGAVSGPFTQPFIRRSIVRLGLFEAGSWVVLSRRGRGKHRAKGGEHRASCSRGVGRQQPEGSSVCDSCATPLPSL